MVYFPHFEPTMVSLRSEPLRLGPFPSPLCGFGQFFPFSPLFLTCSTEMRLCLEFPRVSLLQIALLSVEGEFDSCLRAYFFSPLWIVYEGVTCFHIFFFTCILRLLFRRKTRGLLLPGPRIVWRFLPSDLVVAVIAHTIAGFLVTLF